MEIDNIESINDKIQELVDTNREKSLKMLNSIIENLPIEFSNLIENTFLYKRVPKEYMLCSILFAISASAGLTFYINYMSYTNFANLFFTIVGSRGDAKSEAINIATEPLKLLDDTKYDNYVSEIDNFNPDFDVQPIRKQLLIQDASIEAAHKVHFENPFSIGICLDEIFSLIEKMRNPNSRDGSEWKKFLLEGYTNRHIDVSRKTTDSFRIKQSYPTLIGGIQQQFVSKLFANGNLESGLMDRQLFTPKLTSNSDLIRDVIDLEIFEDYNYSIGNILAYKEQSERKDEIRKRFKIEFTSDADDELFNYLEKLIKRQLIAKPIIREYMAKMQISIHKFCLLVHIMRKSKNSDFQYMLDKETVDLAILLNEFYFSNFKIILEENLDKSGNMVTIHEIVKMAILNGATQKDIVAVTGVNKGTISKLYNKYKLELQLATRNPLGVAV